MSFLKQLTIFDVISDKPKREVSFSEQVSTFRVELSKINEYPDMTDWVLAKHRINHETQYIKPDFFEKEVLELILFASWVGTLIRIAYYKYVHKRGFDPRALWDAIILEYTFSEVFLTHLQSEVRKNPFKKLIEKTRYPEWTKVGLLGGNTSQIKKLGEEFSQYMDELK